MMEAEFQRLLEEARAVEAEIDGLVARAESIGMDTNIFDDEMQGLHQLNKVLRERVERSRVLDIFAPLFASKEFKLSFRKQWEKKWTADLTTDPDAAKNRAAAMHRAVDDRDFSALRELVAIEEAVTAQPNLTEADRVVMVIWKLVKETGKLPTENQVWKRYGGKDRGNFSKLLKKLGIQGKLPKWKREKL